MRDSEEESNLVERLKQFVSNPRKRRRGYRLAHKDIAREWMIDGKALNHKRVYRLWRREGLSVAPRRVRKRMRTGNSVGGLVADHPNAIWCFYFIEIRTLSRQNLRVFCVNDEFTRENHAIEVETSFVSQKVCAVLEKLMAKHGIPSAFRMDNGPELIALALRGLCHRCGINAAYVEPGPGVFPDIKERFRGYIREMDFFLPEADIAFLLRKLEEIPDAGTCVHFDIHSSNIMIRDGEPVIIDMGDLSTGSFLFDIGLLLTIYGIPELGISELATKIPNEKGVELWEAFRDAYFTELDAATIAYIDANIAFLASLRVIYSITFLPALRDSLCSMMTDILLPRMSRG